MCKEHTRIEHFWLMQMLVNFGEKRIIILYFLLPSLLIVARQTNSAFFKKNFRNIMCFIMNWMFSAVLIYLSFSEFSCRHSSEWCFEARI